MSLRIDGTETVQDLDTAIGHMRATIKTYHVAPERLRDALDDLLDAKNDLKENAHG